MGSLWANWEGCGEQPPGAHQSCGGLSRPTLTTSCGNVPLPAARETPAPYCFNRITLLLPTRGPPTHLPLARSVGQPRQGAVPSRPLATMNLLCWASPFIAGGLAANGALGWVDGFDR